MLFHALCVLFKVKKVPMVKNPNNPYKKIADYTTPARNIVMAKPDQMLSKLMAYNSESINKMSNSIINQLKNIQKNEDFEIKGITNVSSAAGKIAGFVNTVVEIYDKLQIINPKREALKQAKESLKLAE